MSQTPFEHAGSLCIGTVDFVSPNEIKVLLDIEAPESVSLNAGGPRPFPRVNSYVLIPVDDSYLVGQVEWITVERSAFPKRRGMLDFGLVDLPFPLRRLSLTPLGTLRKRTLDTEDYIFQRGADALPSIGAAVLLPTDKQLRSIVESSGRRRVKIGTSPLTGDSDVYVDPDRLFGRHLAVLGNTGSGKSCSVAGLIHWSLEAAQERRGNYPGFPNARFIILDPNGEYSQAFSDNGSTVKARIFKINHSSEEYPLQVPLWLWNSAEWCAFTQASNKAQKPTLIQALQFVRDGSGEPEEDKNHEIRRYLRTMVTIIQIEKKSGSPWGPFPKPKSFFEKLKKFKISIEPELSYLSGEQYNKLNTLVCFINELCNSREQEHPHYDFTLQEINKLIVLAREAHSAFGGSEMDVEPIDVDTPRPFSGNAFLRSIEATAEMLNVSEYVETLLIRIRNLLADVRMKPVVGETGNLSLEQWLETYIGIDKAENGCVTIIDLSLVPSEVICIVTAVIARMVFEALQRYVKLNNRALPTVLVMEEAHTFIKRYKDDTENYDAAKVCCQVFERIAREGRKFGLGLVLSSQRPSELSPTVLSQCNSFLLHRITNDRDQELVHRFVPDNLRGLLRELPSLPSQNAILLGWATELPVLVKMRDLPKSQQPRSDDPDFWDVWIGQDDEGNIVNRQVDWKSIVEDWQSTRKVDTSDSYSEGNVKEVFS